MDSQTPNMSELLRIAQSPAGQQLLSLLQQTGGQQLQQAMNQAATGNYDQAKQTLSALLSSPDAQRLMKQLGGNP